LVVAPESSADLRANLGVLVDAKPLTIMLSNYLKIAWRNLLRNKVYSAINIGGLAVGMAVAMLIGLWIYDELSFDKYHQNYDRIAQVMLNQTFNGVVGTQEEIPPPLGNALRTTYGTDFTYVVMSTPAFPAIVAFGDKKLAKTGRSAEADMAEILTLKMLKGTRASFRNPDTILLSESVASAFFGDADPLGKVLKINDQKTLTVTGVYEDLPQNSQFSDTGFIAPWDENDHKDDWSYNSFLTFVQLADHTDLNTVSTKIKDIKLTNGLSEERRYKPVLFLHPMSKWHLYSEFQNGTNIGGRVQFVWLFGIIGVFVLLLACINFMNLSTARSEKRAKEVGIRKAIGSIRSQLISQFFSESFLVVVLAFVLAVGLTLLSLNGFNHVADKQMTMPWLNPFFWSASLGFMGLTGLVAGSYPALYLSGFQPVKVLKGTHRAGRFAGVPRQVLVVVQFTVSVALVIGTGIVYQQIQYAKNRPIGYGRTGLITIQTPTPAVHEHFMVIRQELQKSGAVIEMTESHSPLTDLFLALAGYDWKGKDPNQNVSLGTIRVSPEFGKTVGWQVTAGRDFSRAFTTDSSAMILNQSAAKLMGLTKPIGEIIKLDGVSFNVIGIVKDVLMESPYTPVRPSTYAINKRKGNFVMLKLNPAINAQDALHQIETVLKTYDPAAPFDYKFADQEYALKFAAEERIGNLAAIFAVLTIFISCLGLFGLASFMAEARTKEIGVRKVLGASVLNLWRLLSKDFVMLVIIAFFIATPIAYYFLSNWLQRYEYRTEISWWIFAISGAGALVITLLTVSFQSVKAALMNPVKSLRSE
jgi:putative ABC transport system permease protein